MKRLAKYIAYAVADLFGALAAGVREGYRGFRVQREFRAWMRKAWWSER